MDIYVQLGNMRKKSHSRDNFFGNTSIYVKALKIVISHHMSRFHNVHSLPIFTTSSIAVVAVVPKRARYVNMGAEDEVNIGVVSLSSSPSLLNRNRADNLTKFLPTVAHTKPGISPFALSSWKKIRVFFFSWWVA